MIKLEDIKSSLINKGRFWIVFTGDSITSCEWVHPNWRDIVIYVLQDKLTEFLGGDWKTAEWEIKGFSFAYDGATTKDILERIDDILLVKPDLTIGLMGGNDPTFNISVSRHVSNIERIASKLIAAGSEVVWCNSTPAGQSSKKNPEYKPYAEAVMKIPINEDLQIIDMFNLYQNFPLERIFTFKSEENPIEGVKEGEPDLQHPNQLGNAYIAKVILKEAFGIDIDPEKYIRETLAGEKYPSF